MDLLGLKKLKLARSEKRYWEVLEFIGKDRAKHKRKGCWERMRPRWQPEKNFAVIGK